MKPSDDVPERLKVHLEDTAQICQEFLKGLSFIARDCARDPNYMATHLLSYVFQDFLQSVVAVQILAREGVLNVCKREARFVLEAAIKLCLVQQEQYESDVATKVAAFKADLNSPSISLKNRVRLDLIPESDRGAFLEDVGRLYGETSNYVHLTVAQIMERVRAVDDGRTSGYEAPEEVGALNMLLARGFACALTFLLHSVPEYVAGDMLVMVDGSSADWYFAKSKYIAMIDAHFDYKHERRSGLKDIAGVRESRVTF